MDWNQEDFIHAKSEKQLVFLTLDLLKILFSVNFEGENRELRALKWL